MTELATFTLVPFSPLPEGTDLAITGTLTRKDSVLSISYLIAGDLDAVVLPPLNSSSDRQDRLWEKTCFEIFWSIGAQKSDEDAYWELNFSPTGAWNVFALAGYRKDRKEVAIAELPFTVSHASDGLRLDASVDLKALLPPAVSSESPDQAQAQTQWLLGIAAVAVLSSEKETFWAIAHPGPTADFHRSDSFSLLLSP